MLPNESYLVKVLPESFYLNGHTIGFRSQTKKKIEPPYETPSFTLGAMKLRRNKMLVTLRG